MKAADLHYRACPQHEGNEREHPLDRYPCACAEIDEDLRDIWLEDE